MSSWPSLPAVTVERRPPASLVQGDEGLFAHEYQKSFGPVTVQMGSWDSTDQGMLLRPHSPWVESAWFQSGLPRGLAGLKVRAKGLLALAQPRRPVGGGLTPLVVTDEFSNGYFHWLADGLPKLWWLRDKLDRVNLILPAFARRFAYMTESLAPWPQLTTTVVDPAVRSGLTGAVLVPSLAPTGNYRPELMAGLAAEWRGFTSPAAPFRRVYISRAKAPWRKIRNEDEVWAVLEAQGFERVFLEDLPFAAQVKLVAETQTLVSNHGAGLTNLMFQVPGTQVVEIRLRGDAANNCYYSLASAVGVDYHYLLADPAVGGTDSHTADLKVDAAALTTLVRNLTLPV